MKPSLTKSKILVYLLLSVLFLVFGFHAYYSFITQFQLCGYDYIVFVLIISVMTAIFLNLLLFLLSRFVHTESKILMQVLSYLLIFIFLLIWNLGISFYLAVQFKIDMNLFTGFLLGRLINTIFESVTIIFFLKSISIPFPKKDDSSNEISGK